MGSDTRLFTMKITPRARMTALLAWDQYGGGTHYAKWSLGEILTSSTTGLILCAGEAALLSRALLDYAEKQLRDGSDSQRVANEFAYALGDVAATVDKMTTTAASSLGKALEDERAYMDEIAARSDDAFWERMKGRRDELLRKSFTGGPRYRMNIWTGEFETISSPDPEEERQRLRLRKMAKTILFTAGPSAVRTLQGVVGTAPVALSRQQAADSVDALGPLIDHNVRMKVEGAKQLILDKNRGIKE